MVAWFRVYHRQLVSYLPMNVPGYPVLVFDKCIFPGLLPKIILRCRTLADRRNARAYSHRFNMSDIRPVYTPSGTPTPLYPWGV
jgi:hypothetical protein